MKGIILAAGIGSRLRPMTNAKPKCLVTSAGKTILQYQLDAYRKAGVKNIAIVVGYEGNAIVDYCKHIKDIEIEIIENDIYEDTNNMYSLYLARDYLKDSDFILNNADLTIDENIVKLMIEDERKDLIAVDKGLYNEESMKISVKEGANYISDISKKITEGNSVGCSIDFYKFSMKSGAIFFNEIVKIIEEERNLKDWTEVAMQRLFMSQILEFQPIDISGLSWVEIDNYEDLASSDSIFSQKEKKILDYEHFCFDLDGTVYVGGDLVEGAVEKINYLVSLKKKISFISNNSSKNKSEYVRKLTGIGIGCSESNITLSTDSVIKFLKENDVKKVYVLGTIALERALLDEGFELSEEHAEYVVVGYDTELTYKKLVIASSLINRSIDYVATHCDMFCPSENGPIPDAGALIELLVCTTGVRPVKIFGKPLASMIIDVCNLKGITLEDTVMIGDRLYTDIKLAENANISSVLVLSGETSRDQVEYSEIRPTYILNSIADI